MEASKVHPGNGTEISHDAINRLLYRASPDSSLLWDEVKDHVILDKGILVIDDSTLDKPYANKIDLVNYHWSGKHHRVVKGINLQSLIWTDGDSIIPTDARIYGEEEGKTKNDLFKEMLKSAFERGFTVDCICFDSWYASLENLKFLGEQTWLTRLKANRMVNPDRKGNVAVATVQTPEEGRVVHLKGYGMINIFKTVSKNGDVEVWATNDLNMTALKALSLKEKSWAIEMYHRGLKQSCGIERCQCRGKKAQLNHILLSIRAFLRLERYSFSKGIGWLNAKIQIVRDAVRRYMKNPVYSQYIMSTA